MEFTLRWTFTMSLLFSGIHAQSDNGTCPKEKPCTEWEPYDGWFNNWAHPDWGGAETQMVRKLPAAYKDGVYEPAGDDRPHPMNVSSLLMSGPSGLASYQDRTAFLVFYGQQVVEEILDAQRPGCPPEYFNLEIPKSHVHYDSSRPGAKMPFLRSRYDQRTGFSPNNPRQPLNEISSFIDGTLMYGPNKAWADSIREFEGGRLARGDTSKDDIKVFPRLNEIKLPFANPPPPIDHKLKPIKRFWMLGNPRGNENPFLQSFGIMWFRYHNYWAKKLHESHTDWDDERLFNEARKRVIAVHQKITVYDWLPCYLMKSIMDEHPYRGYNPNIHPGIAMVFGAAAMRYGHTLVPPGVYRRVLKADLSCEFRDTTNATRFSGKRGVRTCNSFWNPQDAISETGIDELLLGMASMISEREDNTITTDLRGSVFGPLDFSRRDLMAINIQRGRDIGLPDYNTARRHYHLTPRTSFSQVIVNKNLTDDDPNLVDRFEELYDNDIENVDIFVGGLLESTQNGPGELFQAIIIDQFLRIRDGDRFWFENYAANGLFTKEEFMEINSTTIVDVLMVTTDITKKMIQPDPFFIDGSPCPQPRQLNGSNPDDLEACSKLENFDYFSGSEYSFALTFLFVLATLFVFIGILCYLAQRHKGMVKREIARSRHESRKPTRQGESEIVFTAAEWQGVRNGDRNIKVKFDRTNHHVVIKSMANRLIRTVDLSRHTRGIDVILSVDRKMTMMVVVLPMEYDLVLRFDHVSEREEFYRELKTFFGEIGVVCHAPQSMGEVQILKTAKTKERRQLQLEGFFRTVFVHAFGEQDQWKGLRMSKQHARDVVELELSKHEFSEALGMKPGSIFVDSMFNLMDTDKSGSISFREFLDLIIVFYKGSADDKAELLFRMYDLDSTGSLSRGEFKGMLRSLIDLANTTIEDKDIDELTEKMFEKGNPNNKKDISLEDFKGLLSDYKRDLDYAQIDFSLEGLNVPEARMKRENGPMRARKTLKKHFPKDSAKERRMSRLDVKTVQKTYPTTPFKQKLTTVIRYIENYKLHIFWVTLYTLVCIGIFAERAYYYSVEREHGGLRRIAGYGVTVTRGAASAQMFTYSCLLITMCRNMITWLRETFLHRYIPFDGAVAMHKFIAYVAVIFTLIHIIGHSINFYHISTQTPPDLICLFRNFFHPTDALPKFERWCWDTITGVTGVLLTINMFVIYVFGMQYARRHSFRAFWLSHHTYVIFFILCVLHGAGRLVQPPIFHYFFIGPVVLFTIDKLISISRKKVEITVVRAELLPSDVTFLEFRRPVGFDYKSGQWVRIACLNQGADEYHPFTLSSAPHEENLSLHIRAVGPWTFGLRRTYDPSLVDERKLPKIYLDGPYGEGHQDWYRYDVAVLVGGGIGVTPFASILKDIANMSKQGTKINCKKVYFLWVTRTQKQFEWMTDIIREVEQNDTNGLVAVHIFITQFKQKFDIRTTMLYICEQYFQKISGRSLFTGLQSITHFGRPDFDSFLGQLEFQHSDVSVFGVFSCGPPPMTRNVEKACTDVNKRSTNVLFQHHFENF